MLWFEHSLMVYAFGSESSGLRKIGLFLHLVETVNVRLVTSSRNRITAKRMTSMGYRLSGVARSVWLEHSSLLYNKLCLQVQVFVSKVCPAWQRLLCLHTHWQVSLSHLVRLLLLQVIFSLARLGRHWQEHESARNCWRSLHVE